MIYHNNESRRTNYQQVTNVYKRKEERYVTNEKN